MPNDNNAPVPPIPPPATPSQPSSDPNKPIVIDQTKPQAPQAAKGGRFNWVHFKRNHWSYWSRRRKIISSAVAVVVIALIAGGLFLALSGNQPKIPNVQTAKKSQIKTTVPSPLTGVQVNPLLAQRPVTAIMIENSDDARPQSGLQDAGVVYEAIAEGGITRFIALFQDTTPQYIGPVRSLRPYYLDFAAAFQASIVHVGGSPDALNAVRDGQFRDLDQFFNADYFTRVSSRPAPHNVYTTFDQLDKLNASKGYTKSTYTPWLRKADSKLKVPTAKTINIAISGPDFNVHYDYDAASNSYLRSEGGTAHMDLVDSGDTTGVQLKPKVVIALVMNYSIEDSSGHSAYADVGSGTAYFFQDGGVTQGTWSRDAETAMYSFADSAGKSVKLNAGQTWITLASNASDVTYAP